MRFHRTGYLGSCRSSKDKILQSIHEVSLEHAVCEQDLSLETACQLLSFAYPMSSHLSCFSKIIILFQQVYKINYISNICFPRYMHRSTLHYITTSQHSTLPCKHVLHIIDCITYTIPSVDIVDTYIQNIDHECIFHNRSD